MTFIILTPLCLKSSFLMKCFLGFFFFAFTGLQTKIKAGVFNSSGWKNFSEKLIFGDGLLSTMAGVHGQISFLLGLYIASNGPFAL